MTPLQPTDASGKHRPAQCPLCDAASERQFAAHGHWLRDCVACGHRFAEITPGAGHVDEVYGDAYFTGGGAGYADYLSEAELLRAHGAQYARLLQRHTAPGRILDIGAAAGLVLSGFTTAGWRGEGLEPNPGMATLARERYGFDVRCGTAETLEPGEPFDAISMIQVVAHFTEPRLAFGNLARRTRPGGWWLIETWDFRSWTARLSGQGWHEYSPPSVLHWYTPERLTRLARDHGFELVARGRPKKRLLGAHAKSLLRYKLGRSRLASAAAWGLNLIPDAAALPYPAEDLFWLLLQKKA